MKINTFILLLLCSLLSVKAVYAETCNSSGTALIPHWFKNSANQTRFWVSNVSDADVYVTVNLFNNDGSLYTEQSESGDNILISNFPVEPTDSPALLLPKAAGNFVLTNRGSSKYGHGEITWNSQTCLPHALIVTFENNWVGSSAYGRGMFTINNGVPF